MGVTDGTEPFHTYETAVRLPDGTIVNREELSKLPHWAMVACGLIDPGYPHMPRYTEVQRLVTVTRGEWEPWTQPVVEVTRSRYTVADLYTGERDL